MQRLLGAADGAGPAQAAAPHCGMAPRRHQGPPLLPLQETLILSGGRSAWCKFDW